MESSARDNYLSTEVLTATPQKLRLLLIEAAIRFAERGRQQWAAGANEEANHSLIRAQEIVSELLAGINYEAGSDLVHKIAGIYTFIFRSLMEANYHRDEKKLSDALRVLEIERQTWRQVCQQHGGRAGPEPPSAAPIVPAPKFLAAQGPLDDLPEAGLSLEA